MSAVGDDQPELGGLLTRLARTVKHDLAPAAADERLAGELYALSSLLRALGQHAGSLAEQVDAERADARAVLRGLAGAADDGDPRAQLVAILRDVDPLPDDAAAYLARDVQRSEAMVLAPPSPEPTEPAEADAAPSLRDPDRGEALRRLVAECVGRDDAEIAAIHPTAAGFAAETVQVDVRAGEAARRLIVRAQWPQLLLSEMPQPVGVQAAAMRLAGASGLAVPTVHGAHDAHAALGAPVLVTEHVDGVVPAVWTPAGRGFLARLREHGVARFVGDLARLHEIPPDLPPPADTADPAARLARLEAWHGRAELRPDPLLAYAFGWLARRVRPPEAPVLVHGDYRPGNIVYGDDLAPRAIIDWDAAKAGDRHEDLATLQLLAHRDRDGRAAGLGNDEELLAAYERASGCAVDRDMLHVWRVLLSAQYTTVFTMTVRSWWERGGAVRDGRLLLTIAAWRRELARLLGII